MGFLSSTPPICPLNQQCSQWARIYLKYCLCSARDGAALTLGMVSVVSWGLAEVPQIITNYKEKSSEGLSIAFLTTWIIGDLFNLIGCLLEPATLPTQFYMALLYTATTLILTGQTMYYGRIYPQLKAKKFSQHHKVKLHEMSQKLCQEETVIKEKLPAIKNDDKESKIMKYQENRSDPANECFHLPSLPIPVANATVQRNGSCGRDLYYMSARSLSMSPIPTAGSWLAHLHNSGRTSSLITAQHPAREPLLGSYVPTESAPPSNTKNMFCMVCSAAFFLVCFSFHLSRNNTFDASPHGIVIQMGRKLLQVKLIESSMRENRASSGIGNFLGWAMAAIYMGGRLPQIYLNIKRGNVEGLNPLMFVFALVGNTTYAGSILINSLDWSKIRPNLPWLVDAGGCVLLDVFILIQFAYFNYRKPKDDE